MEIRDILHGLMQIEPNEIPIIQSKYFQRLRHIHQLGFGENSFPSANHTRFSHSLGTMHVATQMLDSIFPKEFLAYSRFRSIVRLAALLHDVGHGPLSHTTEFAMPLVRDLNLPSSIKVSPQEQASHEHYTLKMILDSGLTPLLKKAGEKEGFLPLHIVALLDPSISLDKDDFFFYEGSEKIDYRPILTQIISSELDADRIDYLRRDSLHTGVSYGNFDSTWLLSHLTFNEIDRKCYLALEHKALNAFEDFLVSRFHMFLMIYFHHKSVIYDEMLRLYFKSSDCSFHLPSDIEAYCEYHDTYLYEHLAHSLNQWAKRIHERKPFQVLIHQHSGIPQSYLKKYDLKIMQEILNQNKIETILSTSSSVLSKYFSSQSVNLNAFDQNKKNASSHFPIFIKYNDHYHSPVFFKLEECTDLFEKYKEKQWVSRLYIAPENDFKKIKELLKFYSK